MAVMGFNSSIYYGGSDATDSTGPNTIETDGSLNIIYISEPDPYIATETSHLRRDEKKSHSRRKPEWIMEQRVNWIRDKGKRPPKVQPHKPQWPHRISMGGANREQ